MEGKPVAGSYLAGAHSKYILLIRLRNMIGVDLNLQPSIRTLKSTKQPNNARPKHSHFSIFLTANSLQGKLGSFNTTGRSKWNTSPTMSIIVYDILIVYFLKLETNATFSEWSDSDYNTIF